MRSPRNPSGCGGLYYFGEFSDHREPGIAMRAKETSDGYEARNGPYSCRIDGDTVTIYQNGNRIGRRASAPNRPRPEAVVSWGGT